LQEKTILAPKQSPVPAIFGMNFQAVSVSQKDNRVGYVGFGKYSDIQIQVAFAALLCRLFIRFRSYFEHTTAVTAIAGHLSG
jgi:hypothetical protein